MLRDMVLGGELTILRITHKFREVVAFAPPTLRPIARGRDS
jgi:hypothetical protein